ncbi:MAG: hypothetical protein J6R68_05465 [Clostridia bacterium]|nr:hypothetical protein [Clostridia bacterium]
MKSKKIVAMFVALVAIMAVATSGLAAVTSTTTTYNEIADKVVIDVDVTEATPGSEVTYLVKSNNRIVYIDQKTAVSGSVSFDYKIANTNIVDLTTDVQFGTNGEATISGTDKAIQLDNVVVSSDGHATVAFYKDAACEETIGNTAIVGDGDTIYAKITVDDNREIGEVTGLEKTATDNVYKVLGSNISITTTSTNVDAGAVDPDQDDLKALIVEPHGEDATKYTKVFKVVGQPKEVGVTYDNHCYKALSIGGAYESDSLYAVAIIVDNETEITELPTYCEAE